MENELLMNDKLSPILSVALPLYNSKGIAWLALESLCRQKNIDFNWELVICEEQNKLAAGKEEVEKYLDRLRKNMCTRVLYIPLENKIPLPQKWKLIGEHVSPSSEAFVLQAGDCYSFKRRLEMTNSYVINKGYDWYDLTKGFFYSFNSDKLIQYSKERPITNLSMAFHTNYARNIPRVSLGRNIDGFLFKHCKKSSSGAFRVYRDTECYLDSLDTNGYNTISKQRESYFMRPRLPFRLTELTLTDLDIPDNVKKRIKSMVKN